MSWYEHSDLEPNSIESQIHTMLFNDLTYRACVSVRNLQGSDLEISAHSPTLAYLLDQGYVLSQVLSIQKLLDDGRGVISVKRLLKDVRKHRKLITREAYVAGDGTPYDYDTWMQSADRTDPMAQMWGIEAPGLRRFAVAKYLHERFDLLSGKRADERTRVDTIRKSIFETLESWLNTPSARELETVRNSFIAHSADKVRRGSAEFKDVRFAQIDELQRAIVRVERSLIDHILCKREARGVVPSPPLGLFRGLDSPYALHGAENEMHLRWNELATEREKWTIGILEDLSSSTSTVSQLH